MKTNVIMNSSDRVLFDVVVRQETKTSFLSLTDLQEAYTRARVLNGWSDKRLNDIFSSKNNIERIYYILKEFDLIKAEISAFTDLVEKQGLVSILKEIGVYKTTGRGSNKSTYCNPYIWMLVALELNPQIYAKVVVWLTDKLILNRIEVGNLYKDLTRAITKFGNERDNYIKVAKALNYKVFGRHEAGIRNFASKEELKTLQDIEIKIAFAIDMGYINDIEKCLNEIQRLNLTK